jgi:hypothetical protein
MTPTPIRDLADDCMEAIVQLILAGCKPEDIPEPLLDAAAFSLKEN